MTVTLINRSDRCLAPHLDEPLDSGDRRQRQHDPEDREQQDREQQVSQQDRHQNCTAGAWSAFSVVASKFARGSRSL